MLRLKRHPSSLGADVLGIDLAQPLAAEDAGLILGALASFGVLRFPDQKLSPAQQKAFAAHLGSLEINVSGAFQDKEHPEVMTLSNIKVDGRPIGLHDAGQDWHTDMSYSADIAFANVLHGIIIPQRDGRPLGNTEFRDMYAAYDALPQEVKTRLEGATATHDFNKFWEEMRRRPGSTRAPLTAEQRARKPPVSQPVVMTHPVSGRKLLYANPGYAMWIDGWDRAESDAMLEFLFRHQLQDSFAYAHRWTAGDVLVWDDLCTIHNAIPDYRPDEPRLIQRCQVMADRIFDPGFAATARFDFNFAEA